ncbi:hypothetical protein GCM10020254_34260 [Streptomyces goshikiensis]
MEGEVDGVAGEPAQVDEVGVGHGADVEVLDGLGGQREEAGPEAVAAVGLPVGEAVLPEGAQQAERGALVHAELLGHLAEPGRTPARAAAGSPAPAPPTGSRRAPPVSAPRTAARRERAAGRTLTRRHPGC